MTALREYLQRWNQEKAAFGHTGEHPFCHPDGRQIHPDTITDWFTRLSWEAGLPPIRLHDVRHSYATAALPAGVPVKVVSERLGHSSVSFTQDTYMHVIPGMDEHGARLAAAAIFGRNGVTDTSPDDEEEGPPERPRSNEQRSARRSTETPTDARASTHGGHSLRVDVRRSVLPTRAH